MTGPDGIVTGVDSSFNKSFVHEEVQLVAGNAAINFGNECFDRTDAETHPICSAVGL